MNDRIRNKGRSAVYAMAGFYLLYLAYEVFKNRADNAGTEQILLLLSAAAFVLIGAGLIGFGLYNMQKVRKQERKALEEQSSREE